MTHYVFETYSDWEKSQIDFKEGDTIEVKKPEPTNPQRLYKVISPGYRSGGSDFQLPNGNVSVNPKYKGRK